MKYYWDLTFVLLVLWRICSIQAQSTSYYKRTYYNAVAPAARYFHINHRSASTSPYSGDLIPQESRRRDKTSSRKPYSKKIPLRPYISEEDDFSHEQQYINSAEYSNEAPAYGSHSNENESREIAIGTQIRVQHPITSSNQNPYVALPLKKQRKQAKPSELRTESTKTRVPKYSAIYDPDPFHVVPPPKSTSPTQALNSGSYYVYEEDQEPYVPNVRTKSHSHDRYKGVASKKQIEKYLEDQQKLLDEALKNQLLSNPKYHKYLNIDDQDNESDLYDIEYPTNKRHNYRGNNNDNYSFKTNRPRRRPPTNDLKRSPKRLPNRKYRSAAVVISV